MSLSTRYVAPMGELITGMMAAFCPSKFLLESNRNLLYFSVYSSVVLNTIVLDPSLRLPVCMVYVWAHVEVRKWCWMFTGF